MNDVEPGIPYPLGATWDGHGVNFALASEAATAVTLCFFDHPDATADTRQIPVVEHTDGVWHCRVTGIAPGQLYGYRVDGPYQPEQGERFNRHKVLLDPYARAVGRELRWGDELFGYVIGDEHADLSFSVTDSAPLAPLGAVIDPAFDWRGDEPLRRPWHETVIYEAHVRGLTRLHPLVPEELRGTYAGVAHDAVIEHLRRLGVTAVELLPVQYHVDDRSLADRKLANYWGYNTLAFFAPDTRYAAGDDPVREFKEMVYRLHRAGLEVILDVVYNHTPEGNEQGPTLSLRGIDNAMYYRLPADAHRYYEDFTGCGNTLNAASPRTMQLIMDSLRYWVADMHVDGFRFDLATALAREMSNANTLGAFFDIIRQDPTLSQVKLIVEPWDVGDGGDRVGRFPAGWAEWNDRYRDAVRRFWRGDDAQTPELATRLAGSADLYERNGRLPYASINFVTAHDGFSLADLVSYDQKHNEANGLDNSDGTDNNLSWNGGAEGETTDAGIVQLRRQQRRNFFATLLLSQGVPMIRAGDELGKTQHGNNNAYCQDNDVSWLTWQLTGDDEDFLAFCCDVVAVARKHPVFRRQKFFRGPDDDSGRSDIVWRAPAGGVMDEQSWRTPFVHAFAMELRGELLGARNADGSPVRDDSFLVLFNGSDTTVTFDLAAIDPGQWYEHLLDTTVPAPRDPVPVEPGPFVALSRSVHLLRERRDG